VFPCLKAFEQETNLFSPTYRRKARTDPDRSTDRWRWDPTSAGQGYVYEAGLSIDAPEFIQAYPRIKAHRNAGVSVDSTWGCESDLGGQMRTNVLVAIAGVIVGGLIVLVYYVLVPFRVPAPSPCGGSPHCIDVSVIMVGGQPQIPTIADENVHNQGVPIFWKIATPGYSFQNNGIVFSKPGYPPPPPGEFTCGPIGNSPFTTFKCIDQYHAKGKWAYTVTLDGSPVVPPLDPFIIND
jgi:hypothetical protein